MAKLWACVINVLVTKHVLVQAPTKEEARHQLDNNLVAYEIDEWSQETSRRVCQEFTRTRKKRSKSLVKEPVIESDQLPEGYALVPSSDGVADVEVVGPESLLPSSESLLQSGSDRRFDGADQDRWTVAGTVRTAVPDAPRKEMDHVAREGS